MIPRVLGEYQIRDARYDPVLTLTGPRQSGKTTLARAVFPSHAYVLREDPRGFLARFPGPVIVDEAQRAPDLHSCVKTAVDEDTAPGRFVLTGSQDFLLMEKVAQTLAGR